MIDKAMHAFRAVGLEDKKDQLAETLSGGEAQRVAVARALVNKVSFILDYLLKLNLNKTELSFASIF